MNKTEIQIKISSLEELPNAAKTLFSFAEGNTIFALYGEIGAGKTTFVRAICEYLNIQDDISSPTFSIINEYESQTGLLYHMDLYRLKQQDEALALGIEEYLYSGFPCFIEWPELIENLLPENTIEIRFEMLDRYTRKVVFCKK